MKTSITLLILALFVAAVASEDSLELHVKQSCCEENAINKAAFKQELIAEKAILDEAILEEAILLDGGERLLRDQEEERLVDEFLNGRELQSCSKSCKTNPNGYWCVVVCGGSGRRRLADDNTVVAGVDPSATTSTTTALRGSRTKSSKRAMLATMVSTISDQVAESEEIECVDFPMEVPELMSRLVDKNAIVNFNRNVSFSESVGDER